MAAIEEPSPTWIEDDGGLKVVFPIAKTPEAKGCAWALFGLASFAVILLPLLLIVDILSGETSPLGWKALAFLVVEMVALGVWWTWYRNVRTPRKDPEPGVLTVQDDVLKIERAGRKQDLDVSWDLAEVADLRISKTYDFWKTWIDVTLRHDELLLDADVSLVRISVTLPSGEVEDAVVVSTGNYWMDDLEGRLREYLGLVPDPARE